MLNFSKSGHLVFCGSSALERGALRSRGKGQLSVDFCGGDDDTAELVLRAISHVRQSAQNLRSSSGHVRRIGLQRLWLFRTIGGHGDAKRIVDNEQNATDQ